RAASPCRQAVSQLEPLRGGPDLHDQGARQRYLAAEAAGLSGRLRSQGGEGLGARFRPVPEAPRQLDGGLEQDLWLSAVGLMSAELRVERLRKVFAADKPAVDDVSFAVAAGEIVALLGPSGCG